MAWDPLCVSALAVGWMQPEKCRPKSTACPRHVCCLPTAALAALQRLPRRVGLRTRRARLRTRQDVYVAALPCFCSAAAGGLEPVL